jgi:oligopeptide transport system substrate-binding protein
MAITEPTAIDPYRAQEVEGIGVTKQLFVGLLRIDSRQRLAPAVAHAWESAESGRLWTFHLRRDVVFSNGEPVDADSFVRGVNRALDPAAATETAYHVAGVRGFEDVRSGAARTLVGLTAPDPWTVVFTLERGDVEFDKKTLQPIFSPVPRLAGPALNPTFNDQPIGNGPYLLAEPWQHGRSITLRRNPSWFGPAPAVAEIDIDILDSASALHDEYAGFRSGRYDYARIPGELVAQAREELAGTGGFLEKDLPGLHYLIPFCHRPPMDNVWARRAVSCAIDRRRLATELFSGTRVPAGSLISPWFTAVHTPGLGSPYTEFDPALARKCAATAGLRSSVDLAYNTGAGHDSWVRAIADEVSEHLGIEVRLHAMTSHELVAHRTSIGASGLCRAGWAYDYPTPDNLLYPLLHSACTAPDEHGTAHGDNEGRYVNPAFDAALDQARTTVDEEERAQRWRDAEGIAMADLPLIPLWYRTEYRVFAADRFAGLDLDFFGNPTLPDVRHLTE